MTTKLERATHAYANYTDDAGSRPYLSEEGYTQGFDRALRGRLGIDLDAERSTLGKKNLAALEAAEDDLAAYLTQSIDDGLLRAEIAENLLPTISGAAKDGEAVLAATDPASDPNSL